MKTLLCLFVLAFGILAVQTLTVKESDDEEIVDYRVELIDNKFKPVAAPYVPPPAKQDEDVLPITINQPILEPSREQNIPRIQGRDLPQKCVTGGTQICLNCSTVANCIDYGNGTIGAEITDTCASPTTFCLKGSCTTDANPQCDGTANITFQCTSTGIFPDPWYCDQYHFCTPTDKVNTIYQFTASCEANYTYNPVTTFCDTHITKATKCNSNALPLQFPVPICNKATPFGGSLGGAYYYLCKPYTVPNTMKTVLYPYIYKCPRGGSYTTGKCTPPMSATANATTKLN